MDPRPANSPANPAVPPLTATVAPDKGDTNSAAPVAPADGPSYPFLSPPQLPDEIGRLGPYRVLGVLGRGGMGVVFRAEETQLKRHIALKVMLPEVAADARAKARFRREAQAQAQVEHENVAVIHQVGEANGVPFIAMPLLKGQTLGAALKQNPRPPLAELVRVGREVAEGLAAAHEKGLVHRDIKPGNVWLDGNKRRVRILDFGLARPEATAAVDPSEPVTASGAIIGTPAYMSPEQAKGEKVDHRSDLFSLGVVLYQMATGKLPFSGSNTFTVLLAVTERHPPAVHEVVPDFLLALSELVWRLMTKEPAARPQTAEAVAAELEALEGSLRLPRVQVIPLSSVVEAPTGPDPWADIDATEPGEREPEDATEGAAGSPAPAARAPAPKARRAGLLWGALGAVVLASGALVAAALLGVGSKAKLIVDADDPNWEVVVKQDGKMVRDRTREREFALPPGEYAVEVANAPAGLQIVPPRVTVAKGGQERVRLWVEKSAVKPKREPSPDKEPSPAPALTAENRKALEAVLALGGSLNLLVNGKDVSVAAGGKLPPGPFLLRDVDLTDVLALNEKSLEMFRAVPPLQRGLTLKNTGITDDDLAKLVSFPGLAKLAAINLTGTSITDAGMGHVRALTALTHLDLAGTRITSAGLAHVRELKLESLAVHGCKVDDAAMDHIADMTSLTRLWLMYTKVGDAGLAKLSKLTNLTYLHPGGITDASAETLLGFRKLTSLHLMGSKFGGAGLKKLAALPALSVVGASECAVDDAGLAALKELPALANLGLNGSKDRVTDRGLVPLAECGGLRSLDLRDTRVTEGGVKALAEKLPLCRIVWDGPAVEPKPLLDVTRRRVAALLKGGVTVQVRDGAADRALTSAEQLTEKDRILRLGVFVEDKRNPLDDPAVVDAFRHFPTETWLAKDGVIAASGITVEQFRTLIRLPGGRGASGYELYRNLGDAAVALLRNSSIRALAVNPPGFVTDAGLEHIAAIPGLDYLNLTGGKITSGGLAALRGRVSLIHLTLRDCADVDDAAAEHLATLATLRHLNLKGTNFTKVGVEKLATALPRCRITWDGGVIEPKTQAEIERTAAEVLNPHADLVLKPASGQWVTVKTGEKLPAEPFAVIAVYIERRPNDPLAPDFAAKVLFPALAGLRELQTLDDNTGRIAFTEQDLARLADLPARETLTTLQLPLELTGPLIDTLKRFPRLAELLLPTTTTEDAVFERLKELSKLVRLAPRELGTVRPVNPAVWKAITSLPLATLEFERTSLNAEATRLIAAMPALKHLSFFSCGIGDDDLAELAKRSNLTTLTISTAPKVTDAGLAHLMGLTGLRSLSVKQVKVTEAGVKALADKLPRCRIEWDGGVIEPTKKP